MHGMMMDVPLTLTSVMRHAESIHGQAEVVSRDLGGIVARTNYAEIFSRCRRLANALKSLGLEPGDRVGTLAWSTARHLELYFGVSCAGFVCHTINPRLFPEQIAHIIRHAGDRLLFVDPHLVKLLEPMAAALDEVRAVVVMCDRTDMPESSLPALLCYEDLLAGAADQFDWPVLDERAAAALCYTSGTTGDPKGVLYSHRSSVLHAMAICMPDVFTISGGDVVMPVVPMFHVAAWGMPYAAPMVGARLVLPGPRLDGASLQSLISGEGVTCTAGVPTVWMAMLDWVEANGASLAPLNRVGIGGSACPPALARRFEALGIEVVHAWGMTETSPVALSNRLQAKHRAMPPDELARHAAKQGRPVFGIETRVVDGEGRDVPADGFAAGTLLVRGPWVASGYFNCDETENFAFHGWFSTGDVVSTEPDGTVEIVDRTKDVIKSGGEWISSILLENIAVAHPAVQEAAAVARPDPHWGERPMLVVVLRPGATFGMADMLAHFEGRLPKWAVPTHLEIVGAAAHGDRQDFETPSAREFWFFRHRIDQSWPLWVVQSADWTGRQPKFEATRRSSACQLGGAAALSNAAPW